MSLLAEVTVRSTILILLALGANQCLRHRSAAIRHAVLAAAMCGALSLLPLQMLLPSWQVPFYATPLQATASPRIVTSSSLTVSGSIDDAGRVGQLTLTDIAVLAWAAGAGL